MMKTYMLVFCMLPIVAIVGAMILVIREKKARNAASH
jgi:hypothetical protein